MTKYKTSVEQTMLNFYGRLNEKDKRHYAALETQKLGYGGKQYIGILLGISQKTLRKAEQELAQVELMAQIPPGHQRRRGGGRKKIHSKPRLSSVIDSLYRTS